MSDNAQNETVIASGWEDVAKAAASGGSYLKLESGQIVMVNVCGTPVFYQKTFKPEEGPKRRVRVDVFVPGDGRKIFEMAPGTLRELMEEREECKSPFADALYAIKRVGSGKDTVYKFRYQRPLSPAELAEREALAPLNGAAKAQEAAPF